MLLTPWRSFGTLGRRGEVAERRLLVESELERSSNGGGARVCWRGRRELEGIQGGVRGTLNRGRPGALACAPRRPCRRVRHQDSEASLG